MTKEEEKELDDICSFYAADEKMTEALKAAIIKHKAKYIKVEVKKESLDELFDRIVNDRMSKLLENRLN